MKQRTFAAVTVVLAAFAAAPAAAVTITYVNAGTADSRVFAGFDNDASGYMTSDLVNGPAAVSRNDTAYGPLPPAGQLPNFDAECYASAELGTNLNVTGTGVRSVFAPFNPTFFRASGMTIQSTGAYACDAYAFSGPTTATAPSVWIVHVDPSPGETLGDPVVVTIDASISGTVTAGGAATSEATWTVTTTSNGGVIAGAAAQLTPGTSGFSDSGTLQFQTTLGGTFELAVDYNVNAIGSGAGAASEASIDTALVEVSAALGTLVTPPGPVLTAFDLAYPDAEVSEWIEIAEGLYWVVVFEFDGHPWRRVYRRDGWTGGPPIERRLR